MRSPLARRIASRCWSRAPASAQNWPDKPIKFVVAAPAGSSLDVLARTIADKLKDRLGQSVVVDDRPAAGGTVATDFVAKSAPDGYTMVISFNGPLAFGPLHLHQAALRSAEGSRAGHHHIEPAERARRHRDAADQVGQGTRRVREGQSGQAQLRLGRQRQLVAADDGAAQVDAGIDIVHVPFNGSPPAVTATIQGETQMLFAVMQPLQAQIQAGKLRAIAVTTAKRFPLLPDIPTIAEAGYPGFEALAWNGILVAAGTPRPIIQRLNTEINAILKDPSVKSTLNAQGFDLIGGTPEDFANLIRSESEKWAPVIKRTGAKID